MKWTRSLQALSQAIRLKATELLQWFTQPAKSTALVLTPASSTMLNQHLNKHLLEIKKIQSNYTKKGYKINIE
jgi:DNA polymerase III delta subunit